MFRIRCSAIGEIMGGALNRPTEKQLQELDMLQAKPNRTELQSKKLEELIAKRDTPNPLSEGAKTYCETWLKERIYGRYKEFSSKYTEKGIECEQAAIDLFSDVYGFGMLSKNEQFFENEHITGTPDIILADSVADIKCSWDCFSFPLFSSELDNDSYWWQMQGYMELTGKSLATVNYCLMDAPEFLMEREARNAAYKIGSSEVSMELYDKISAKMTYSHLDNHLRIKSFTVSRDDEAIKAIYSRVEMCREYIKTLHSSTKETK